MELLERFRGCLLGLATGDAVGTTVEFQPRGSFAPVTDMRGGGPFHLNPGEWTDDTAMALCLATSLVAVQAFDPRDQMERYCRWMQDGTMSSNGTCFDIGNTTAAALQRFLRTGEPYSGRSDPRSAGNGSIMRLAPVPMFYYANHQLAVALAADSSRTTHGAQECLDACRLFASILVAALRGEENKKLVLSAPLMTAGERSQLTAKVEAIASGAYLEKPEDQISGSGYVVDCLEAALWCFWHSDSYTSAILKAVNLGDDADTTGAVCGQIAGAYYGIDNIPADWLAKLAHRELIDHLATDLFEGASAP